jgi:hypothetical protein
LLQAGDRKDAPVLDATVFIALDPAADVPEQWRPGAEVG